MPENMRAMFCLDEWAPLASGWAKHRPAKGCGGVVDETLPPLLSAIA
jgi:hypothetical protein